MKMEGIEWNYYKQTKFPEKRKKKRFKEQKRIKSVGNMFLILKSI